MTSTPSEELKACPFCGSSAVSIKPNIHTGLLRVQCEACWAVTATSVTSNNRQTAIAAWNRRPTSSRREVLEEAARVAETVAAELSDAQKTRYAHVQIGSHLEVCTSIASAIRALAEEK